MSDNNSNTKDFSLTVDVGSKGKIASFRYSHSLRELVGSWSAEVVNDSFQAGDSFSVKDLMKDGIITSAYKDHEGLWHLEGKDAGYRLMKSIPSFDELPERKTFESFIQALASECSITVRTDISEDEGDYRVRSLISGSTYAEAILEAAMFGGYIVYFNHDGELVLDKPTSTGVPVASRLGDIILSDSESSLDLDGYATHVLIQLSYKHKFDDDDDDDDEEETIGKKPQVKTESFSGIIPNGFYSFDILQPFGVIKKLYTEITDGETTIKNTEEHSYTHKKRFIWRDKQEFALFAFIEDGYTLTREVTGKYDQVSFSENTTETFERTLSGSYDRIGVPDEWSTLDDDDDEEDEDNDDTNLTMVSKETITRSTVRTGAPTPDSNMPPYSPPFDSKITRTFEAQNRGLTILTSELEETYEARQLGAIAPVTLDGKPIPHFFLERDLAIQTHSSPQWVLVKTHRDFFDVFDNDGNCIVSSRNEYSDEGNEWVADNALPSTGDEKADKLQKAYAHFTQRSQGLQLSLGNPHYSTAWHFLEVTSRTKKTVSMDEKIAALGDISSWYDEGAYVRSTVCPHYNQDAKSCNVYMYAGKLDNTGCSRRKGTHYWQWCDRAIEALKKARELDISDIDAPVYGMAGNSSSGVGYKRELFIDDELKKEKAETAASALAEHILDVKSKKGFCKTAVIPYNPDLLPDGDIIDVSHDWSTLQTSVTYRTIGSIPQLLIPQSASDVADFVAARYSSRTSSPTFGKYLHKGKDEDDKEKDNVFIVSINNKEFECSSKVRGLQENDLVIVIFPAGNKFHGQIIARL